MLLCHILFSHLIIINNRKKRELKYVHQSQKHDYHLVDPSPWPLATSFATLVTAVGSVYYFHSKVSCGQWLLRFCPYNLLCIYVV